MTAMLLTMMSLPAAWTNDGDLQGAGQSGTTQKGNASRCLREFATCVAWVRGPRNVVVVVVPNLDFGHFFLLFGAGWKHFVSVLS